ncbi:MAG: hypothetical protein HKL85_11460 [Acidimicrobiaceae bacterium]|nr:hypothetical protein [Acidimicrobiaceae bacterium]
MPLRLLNQGNGERGLTRSAMVEVPIPQAKPWLVRLAPFRIETRTLRRPSTARERVLGALTELGVLPGRAEFQMSDIYRHLGVAVRSTEYLALQRAIDRMYRGDRGRAPELTRVGLGRYRRI